MKFVKEELLKLIGEIIAIKYIKYGIVHNENATVVRVTDSTISLNYIIEDEIPFSEIIDIEVNKKCL